jgi:hypothetical protein
MPELQQVRVYLMHQVAQQDPIIFLVVHIR